MVAERVGVVAVLAEREAPVVGLVPVVADDGLDAFVELLGDVAEDGGYVVVIADAGCECLAGNDEGSQLEVGGGRPPVLGVRVDSTPRRPRSLMRAAMHPGCSQGSPYLAESAVSMASSRTLERM